MALRQITWFVESLLRLVGLDWDVPDFSTLSRCQKTLVVHIPHRVSQGPLHLLIDSTGIEVEMEGEWNARKHGETKRRVWRKVHLGIDEQTLEIRADCAYDTLKCHDAIAERGAAAVLPPRKNAKPWKADSAVATARNEALRASKHLGRALWRRWSGYHRRSRAETKMHSVTLLGQRLMARDFDRQVAEFQVRVAVLNGYTALGIPVTKVVG